MKQAKGWSQKACRVFNKLRNDLKNITVERGRHWSWMWVSSLGYSMNGHVINRNWDVRESNHCLTNLDNGYFTGKSGVEFPPHSKQICKTEKKRYTKVVIGPSRQMWNSDKILLVPAFLHPWGWHKGTVGKLNLLVSHYQTHYTISFSWPGLSQVDAGHLWGILSSPLRSLSGKPPLPPKSWYHIYLVFWHASGRRRPEK